MKKRSFERDDEEPEKGSESMPMCIDENLFFDSDEVATNDPFLQ